MPIIPAKSLKEWAQPKHEQKNYYVGIFFKRMMLGDLDREQNIAGLLLIQSLAVVAIAYIFVREVFAMTYPLLILSPFVAYYAITKRKKAAIIGFLTTGISMIVSPLFGWHAINIKGFVLLGIVLVLFGLILIIHNHIDGLNIYPKSEYWRAIFFWILGISLFISVNLYFHFTTSVSFILEIIFLSAIGVIVLVLHIKKGPQE